MGVHIFIVLLIEQIMKNRKISTVGINPTLSDPFTSQTSKLGWRYFEANEVDRKKNSRQKGTGTKMAENFERKKKSNFSPVLNPDTFR